jgi:L-asparaginase II
MRAAPEMVAGPGSFDSLANAVEGVVAKRGAMGVFCCASERTGRAGALKVEDGSFEAMEPAALDLLAAVAGPLDERFDPWRERPIRDGDGAPVGSWSGGLALGRYSR